MTQLKKSNGIMRVILGVILVAGFIVEANATLIGDTVGFRRQFNGFDINVQNAVVGPGIEFTDTGSTSNVSASSIRIDFTSVGFNGCCVPNQFIEWNSLDWIGAPNGIITGVNVTFGGNITDSNPFPAFSAANVTFAPHLVRLEVGGYQFTSAFVQMDLITNHVPEPVTLALLGLGLAGLGLSRKRKSARTPH